MQMLEAASNHMCYSLICFSKVSAPIRMVLQGLQHYINGATTIKIDWLCYNFTNWCCKLVEPFDRGQRLCSTICQGLESLQHHLLGAKKDSVTPFSVQKLVSLSFSIFVSLSKSMSVSVSFSTSVSVCLFLPHERLCSYYSNSRHRYLKHLLVLRENYKIFWLAGGKKFLTESKMVSL